MIRFAHLEELREYVRRTLCERHSLDPSQYPMDEHILTRRNRISGLYFCQYGPRMMHAHAVWDAERGVLAFYDTGGNRFLKERVASAAHLVAQLPNAQSRSSPACRAA